MGIVLQIFGLLYLESSEIGIANKFMSGNHLVGAYRNYLAIVFNQVYNQTEPIQLCKIFTFNKMLLSTDV